MSYFAGVDLGSTTIKVVLIDMEENIRAHCIIPTGGLFHQNAEAALERLLQQRGIAREEIPALFATGYGRKLFAGADDTISEITANAVGASRMAGGTIRTIINIGGQDLKVISLDDDGHVKNFAMNDKCAAGTGRFLEMTARILELEVEELGDYHLRARGMPATINSTCTVFAESELISLLAGGHPREELVAGIHYSIARRVARLAHRLGLREKIYFDGGPALNQGLVEALETELMEELTVPETPQITTAYGAAVLAAGTRRTAEQAA